VIGGAIAGERFGRAYEVWYLFQSQYQLVPARSNADLAARAKQFDKLARDLKRGRNLSRLKRSALWRESAPLIAWLPRGREVLAVDIEALIRAVDSADTTAALLAPTRELVVAARAANRVDEAGELEDLETAIKALGSGTLPDSEASVPAHRPGMAVAARLKVLAARALAGRAAKLRRSGRFPAAMADLQRASTYAADDAAVVAEMERLGTAIKATRDKHLRTLERRPPAKALGAYEALEVLDRSFAGPGAKRSEAARAASSALAAAWVERDLDVVLQRLAKPSDVEIDYVRALRTRVEADAVDGIAGRVTVERRAKRLDAALNVVRAGLSALPKEQRLRALEGELLAELARVRRARVVAHFRAKRLALAVLELRFGAGLTEEDRAALEERFAREIAEARRLSVISGRYEAQPDAAWAMEGQTHRGEGWVLGPAIEEQAADAYFQLAVTIQLSANSGTTVEREQRPVSKELPTRRTFTLNAEKSACRERAGAALVAALQTESPDDDDPARAELTNCEELPDLLEDVQTTTAETTVGVTRTTRTVGVSVALALVQVRGRRSQVTPLKSLEVAEDGSTEVVQGPSWATDEDGVASSPGSSEAALRRAVTSDLSGSLKAEMAQLQSELSQGTHAFRSRVHPVEWQARGVLLGDNMKRGEEETAEAARRVLAAWSP
jgi:hypothetical protein